MRAGVAITFVSFLLTLNLAAAQRQRGDDVPLRNWPVAFDTGRLHPGTDTSPLFPSPPANFVAVSPCRVVDTRNANGAYGGPKLVSGTSRSFMIPNGPCAGIPVAAAYSLNLTVNQPEANDGFLIAYPTGSVKPLVASLNFNANETKGNAAIVPADGSGSIDIFTNVTTHVIIDINGYFTGTTGATNLTTYNLAGSPYSLTIPAGVTRILVEAWGGGGGGGYATGAFPGGFGGNGGYARAVIPVSSNTTLTVTIGGGGAGATVANGTGTAGSDTVIALNATALLTAGGGAGGTGTSFGNGAGGSVSGDPSLTFFQRFSATGGNPLGFVAGVGGVGGVSAPGGSGTAGMVTVTFVQ